MPYVDSYSLSSSWSTKEDSSLHDAVLRHGTVDWDMIAAIVTERAPELCRQRWGQIQESGTIRGNWCPEEDRIIIAMAVNDESVRWSEVASKLLGLRTGKQCRERWYNHLHPSLKKSPWTEDEDERLIELQKSLGNSWSKISQSLPGRSENEIKNRWYCYISKHYPDQFRNHSHRDHSRHNQTVNQENGNLVVGMKRSRDSTNDEEEDLNASQAHIQSYHLHNQPLFSPSLSSYQGGLYRIQSKSKEYYSSPDSRYNSSNPVAATTETAAIPVSPLSSIIATSPPILSLHAPMPEPSSTEPSFPLPPQHYPHATAAATTSLTTSSSASSSTTRSVPFNEIDTLIQYIQTLLQIGPMYRTITHDDYSYIILANSHLSNILHHQNHHQNHNTGPDYLMGSQQQINHHHWSSVPPIVPPSLPPSSSLQNHGRDQKDEDLLLRSGMNHNTLLTTSSSTSSFGFSAGQWPSCFSFPSSPSYMPISSANSISKDRMDDDDDSDSEAEVEEDLIRRDNERISTSNNITMMNPSNTMNTVNTTIATNDSDPVAAGMSKNHHQNHSKSTLSMMPSFCSIASDTGMISCHSFGSSSSLVPTFDELSIASFLLDQCRSNSHSLASSNPCSSDTSPVAKEDPLIHNTSSIVQQPLSLSTEEKPVNIFSSMREGYHHPHHSKSMQSFGIHSGVTTPSSFMGNLSMCASPISFTGGACGGGNNNGYMEHTTTNSDQI